MALPVPAQPPIGGLIFKAGVAGQEGMEGFWMSEEWHGVIVLLALLAAQLKVSSTNPNALFCPWSGAQNYTIGSGQEQNSVTEM